MPELVQTGLELVAAAGRVVVVGLSSDERPGTRRRPAVQGDRPPRHELLQRSDFAAAVDLVGRRRDVVGALVTHEFRFEQAPEAIAFAIAHPAEVMKAVVRL